MSLQTIVKVGGITNLSDARYCAGMGVDILGFCFSKKSDNYIELEKFKEITNWVSGVEIVAEFDQESETETDELFSQHPFDGLVTSNLEVGLHWKSKGKRVILNVELASMDDIMALDTNKEEYTDFDLVQISCNDSSLFSEVEIKLTSWSEQLNILKAFNIQDSNVLEHIEDGIFKGIALTGSHEEKPGMKDYDEIADILEALEED